MKIEEMEKQSFMHLKFGKGILLGTFLAISTFGQSLKTTVFTSTNEDFANPERGWMSSEEVMNESFPQELWPNKPMSRLSWIRWTISDFRDGRDLTPKFYSEFQKMCDAARAKGFKIIPRVRYTDDRGPDAPLQTVLKHVSQLKDIFAKNADVIYAIDPGMVGYWGEWHSSTNNLLELNSRNAIIEAVLKATPPDRMTYIRYPVYKIDYIKSKGITDYILDSARAFNGSDIARIGHLNDCLFSTEDDAGTYYPQASTTIMNREIGLDYMAHETPYVPHGGETCKEPDGLGISKYNECGNVLKQFPNLHINHLNSEFSEEIYWRWRDDGCLDSISRSLGYRFSLLEAQYSQNIKPGGLMTLAFKLVNKGFGELFNPRDIYIVLQNQNGEKREAVLALDPRRWVAGKQYQITTELEIPTNLPEGTYKIGIWAPDKYASLKKDPRYAVRFANQGIWEDSSGLNILAKDILVSNSAPGTVNTSFTTFKQHPQQAPVIKPKKEFGWDVNLSYQANRGMLVIKGLAFDANEIELLLLDINGVQIASAKKYFNASQNTIEWKIPRLRPEIYLVQIVSKEHSVFKKFTLLSR